MNNLYDTAQASVCCSCGGMCEANHITLTLRRATNTFILVRNVPAEVCQECGEAQFSLWAAGQLTSALHLRHTPDDVAILPIYDFPAA